MWDSIQKKYADTILKPWLLWYLKKERTTVVNGFKLTVKPTVFHPAYFFSSQYLAQFVSQLSLTNKKVLELGCGSGIISLTAWHHGGIVTAIDINKKAVECTELNFKQNAGKSKQPFRVFESDLFDAISPQVFDVILINPPYFFENNFTGDQLAWNCGKNGEYFQKLFSKMRHYMNPNTDVYMILAQNCDIARITELAKAQQFQLTLHQQKKIKWEMNYIFKII